MERKKHFFIMLRCTYLIYFKALALIAFVGCLGTSLKTVDFIPDEKHKGFVEFYPSDDFVKDSNFSIFKIDIYKYKPKGPKGYKRLFTETCGKGGVRVAQEPGLHTFFISPQDSSHSEKVQVEVFDKKVTPVKINVFFVQRKSSISTEEIGPLVEEMEVRVDLIYKMFVTVEKPVPIE